MVSRVTGPSANCPFRIVRVSVTGSTNADLLARAGAGEPAGLVMLADHQTAGRGRLERRWEAPPGANVLASVLLRPARPVDTWFHSTVALGLAVVDACRSLGVAASLKWPNDVLVGDAKLAGILAETDGRGALVIGLGCNLGWPPAGELPGATSLVAHGVECTPADFLDLVLARFDDGAADLLERYRRCCATIGRTVHIDLPNGDVVDGLATAVDDDGLLVVEVDAASPSEQADAPGAGAGPAFVTRRFAVGDVVHARSGPRSMDASPRQALSDVRRTE
jgi:BirA family transcriptional regulator, biotin operon repressor / biotin---[acetyl-CoA-carboxylase] ligase